MMDGVIISRPASANLSPELKRQLRVITLVGLAMILFGFLGAIIWAALAPLSGSIVAMGFVKVDTNRKTVQHRDGGIVSEILVRERR